MKRRWRAGRVILAVLLLGLAGLAFYSWPIGPRWRIGARQPIGFDFDKGLLYTTNEYEQRKQGHYEVEGYDLPTGQHRVRMSLDLKEHDQFSQEKWSFLLSADSSTLVCWNDSEPTIAVMDVHAQCQRIHSFQKPHLSLDSICLSRDGLLLALRCYEAVQIWNCGTRTMLHEMKMPSNVVTQFRTGLWLTHPEAMQFSEDKRFLAVTGDLATTVVFDVASGHEVRQHSSMWVPCFLADNQTLRDLPWLYAKGSHVGYYYGDESLEPLAFAKKEGINDERLLTATRGLFVTFQSFSPSPQPYPAWIPTAIQEKLESVMKLRKNAVILRIRDTNSNEVEYEVKIRTGYLSAATVSSDGRYLAFIDGKELCLWDIPPRRSLTCWLVCSALVLLALFLVWLRPVKQQQLKSGPA